MKKIFLILFIILSVQSRALISPGPYYPPFDTTAGYGFTAFYDLDNNATTIRDWTGWTGSSWVSGHAYDGHGGTDYGMNIGTEIRAAQNGYVDAYADGLPLNDHSTGNGNYIRVRDNTNTWRSYTLHLSPTVLSYVSTGTNVVIGQKIADSNNTGNSTGPHLHFQPEKNSVRNCPFLSGWWAESWVGCKVVKVINTPDLNVRTGAGSGYSIITVIGQDAMFVSSENSGGWYRIFLPGSVTTTGWCSGSYLSIVNSASVTEVIVNGTGNTLNVRSGPSTGYSIITTIPDGTRFIALSKDASSGTPWYQIYLPGAPYSTGWCSSDYLVVYNDFVGIEDWQKF